MLILTTKACSVPLLTKLELNKLSKSLKIVIYINGYMNPNRITNKKKSCECHTQLQIAHKSLYLLLINIIPEFKKQYEVNQFWCFLCLVLYWSNRFDWEMHLFVHFRRWYNASWIPQIPWSKILLLPIVFLLFCIPISWL